MKSTPTNTYFLYARKSTESEDRQMASIDDQITEMTRLAEKRGLNIVDIVRESKSAKAPGRKKFNELLERIHKGEANSILTWKLNRLARNPIDGGQISWMLQQNIIKHIQTYGSDYHPQDNVLLMQIEFGMANQFVKDLSVSVSRGMRLKAERGWFPASQLPTGYVRNPIRSVTANSIDIIPDPKRFKIVKKLWKDAITGDYSIADLERKAYRLGLRNKSGNSYNASFFYKLFQNEFYCGYFRWKNEDGYPTRHKGKHKIMVSEDEFKNLQRKLFHLGNHKQVKNDEFQFRGILKCGECGRGITAQRKLQCICTGCKIKFSCKVSSTCPKCQLDISKMNSPSIIDQTYYHCSNPKSKCSQKPVNGKILERQFKSLLKLISISEEFYDYAINAVEEFREKANDINSATINPLEKEIKVLEKRLQKITLLRVEEEIDAHEFSNLKLEIKTEIENLQNEISKISSKVKHELESKKDYLKCSKNLIEQFENGSIKLRKTLLSKLSSNLILNDKTLYFSMSKALFRVLVNYELYKIENSKLEPKKSLMFQRGLAVFTLPLSVGEPTCKKLEPQLARLEEQLSKLDTASDELL